MTGQVKHNVYLMNEKVFTGTKKKCIDYVKTYVKLGVKQINHLIDDGALIDRDWFIAEAELMKPHDDFKRMLRENNLTLKEYWKQEGYITDGNELSDKGCHLL